MFLLLIALAIALLAGGATPAYAWSYPFALNTNAATDSKYDQRPQVTTDGAGNWVAVWQSNENLGGIGTDVDILCATAYIPSYPPVGGIAELPDVSGSSTANYIALAALAVAALFALMAAGWYARRRWSR